MSRLQTALEMVRMRKAFRHRDMLRKRDSDAQSMDYYRGLIASHDAKSFKRMWDGKRRRDGGGGRGWSWMWRKGRRGVRFGGG